MAFVTEDSGDGKGEKVVQETTSRRAIVGLFRLEAASSRKPLFEGCPPDALATTEGRTLSRKAKSVG